MKDMFETIVNNILYLCVAKDPDKERTVFLTCNKEYKEYLNNQFTNQNIRYIQESNHSDYESFIVYGIKINIIINEDFTMPMILVRYE